MQPDTNDPEGLDAMRAIHASSIIPGVIAATFALSAFSIAVLSGLLADNEALSVVARALLCMLVCYPVGLLVGHAVLKAIRLHLEAYVVSNPIPEPPEDIASLLHEQGHVAGMDDGSEDVITV